MSVKWCGVTSQVTFSPRDLAQRTCSSDALAERCATCNRAPVSSASCTSRATHTDSAAAGIPGKPRRVDVTPSRITAPAASDTSSECSITGIPSDWQYSITCRASFAVAMGLPSSLTATMPASFMAAISAMASPWLPMEAAPVGRTRAAAVRALSIMKRVIAALSCTGRVFGMQQTAVNPPFAAARVPVSMVSEDSWPGSRRCTCRSINPGATINPAASKISAPRVSREIFPVAATSAMVSPSRSTSSAASVLVAGSTTRPFLTRSMRSVLCVGRAPLWRRLWCAGLYFRCRMRAFFRRAYGQEIQHRHAHRYPVGHLFDDAGLRAVGHFRRDLDAAIHRPGMQHDGVRLCAAQSLRAQLIEKDVVARGKRRLVQALGLHAQHQNHVRAFERFLDAKHAPDLCALRADVLEFPRNPHRRTAQGKLAAEFSQQLNIRARYAAVRNVSENGHVQILDSALALANGQRVEQALRRMLVHAVACIDHRNVQMPGHKIARA